MANFADTNLLNAQVILSEMFNEDFRQKVLPGIGIYTKNTNFIFPDAASVRASEKRTIVTNQFKRATNAVVNVRNNAHTGPTSDSATTTLSWTTYARNFNTSITKLQDNVLGSADSATAEQISFAQNVMNSILDLHADIETALITHAFTNRTQVNAATENGTFDGVNEKWDVASGDANFYFQFIKSMMRQNRYQDRLYDVINTETQFAVAEQQFAQGGGNSTNLNFQFNQLNNFVSTELGTISGDADSSLIFPERSVGVLNWIPKTFRDGVGMDRSRGDKNQVFTTFPDPIVPEWTWAVHRFETGVDNSGANGNLEDIQVEYEFSIDLSPASAFISVATETPIFQTNQL